MIFKSKKWVVLLVFACFVSTFSFSQTTKKDSIPKKRAPTKLKYNFTKDQKGGIFLEVPSTKTVSFDAVLNLYIITEKIGDFLVRPPIYMTPEKYEKYRLENDILSYYKSKIDAAYGKKKTSEEDKKNLLPKYYVNNRFFETIFGGNEIEITPTGNINLRLGAIYQNTENPQIAEANRSSLTFDFDQQISASLRAKIGKRLQITTDYDTQASFDFQNLIKLEYTPTEDDIIQNIEAGNVSMPIKNSLINGAQSLFGIKTELKFGNTNVKAIFSQQNSESKVVTAQAGATIEPFELRATDYDNDRHFFLAQYFRDNYANSLSQYPLISSQVNITRVEVWITNRNATTEDFRSIVAFADIGESENSNFVNQTGTVRPTNPPAVSGGNLPTNGSNNLSTLLTPNSGIRDISSVEATLNNLMMQQGSDYSILQNARKLQATEYTLNAQLGYVSLNRRLNDGEVLAVAYEYTVAGQVNGSTANSFKVGELSNDGIQAPNNLAVKLLRSEILTTKRPDGNGGEEAFPTWRLMMKNIYALGAYPLSSDGFRFEVQYRDDQTGVASNTLQNALTPGIANQPLIQVLNIDRLDQSQFVNADGFFDYVEGITVNSQNGFVIFPEPEPFGENLNTSLTAPADKDKFVFEELYLNTKINIQNNFQNKDKFLLKGYFKSKNSGGIPLNAFNVPRGSVNVTAGGRRLVEGVDYVVDYQFGSVQIIDPSIEASGVPIQVSVENNAVFNQQRKTFTGIDIEHQFSKDFVLGATYLNVEERPLTPKVNYGLEPIDNSMLGLRLDYATEVPFFTKLANKLPFVTTDVPSNLSLRAEMAYLIPGTPSGIQVTGGATSYIDDFEASQVPISLLSPLQWYLASTPKDGAEYFNGDRNDLTYNDKRAKLAWYSIDQIFYGFGNTPGNIDADQQSRAETRQISYDELFPNTQLDITQNTLIRTLDLAYFPQERGSYNFNTNTSEVSVDVANEKVTLLKPEENWGGIMRPLNTNNFDQANVEYIQFWVMDPYDNYSITAEEGLNTDPQNVKNQVGDLYINLGNISEDIHKDNLKMYENGLPADGNKAVGVNVRKSTLFGVAPFNPSIIYAFDEDDASRTNQDVGFDGLNDAEERTEINNLLPGTSFGNLRDPAGDNFQYYRGGNLDAQNASILSRYKNFNNTQGNSPTLGQSAEAYPTSGTTYPDVEDINRDQTMNTIESYYEYKISMNKTDLVKGNNFIVDEKITNVTLENGNSQQTKWYQFRVPVRSGTARNGISDFNSIRFMRMYLTNFKIPIVIRFGELDLVRGDYRRYTRTLNPKITPRDLTELEINNFEVGVVSIEQNDGNYVLPPGIIREELQGSTTVQQQNEQSVTLKVNRLENEEIRAIYKNISIDLRRSKNLKMFIHAAPLVQGTVLDDDLVAILRIGTDLDENFYQLEIPLKISPNGSLAAIDVWPEANNLDALLENFGLLKVARDNNSAPINELYPTPEASDPKELIVRVKGNPTLAQIRTVMLGIKNTAPTPRSAEIWFNELRSSGFDNEGGWAGVLNVDANFADVANVAVSGRIQTVGFGNVEDRISQRSLDESKQYDVATSIDLAKVFTPKKWGLQVPMTYSIGEQFIDPKFDRQYQDVKLAAIESDSLIAISRDYTRRTSISFINVKKNRNPNTTKKPRFYDVENLTVSYSQNRELHSDYNIKQYINEVVTATAGYNYNFQSDFIEPFKKTKFLDKKYLKIIKDFNFNPIPKTFALNSRVNRSLTEQQSRNLVEGLSAQPKLTQRRFLFDWDYTVAFDLTKSVQLNFNATNSYIYDAFGSGEDLQIFDNFFNTGRQNQYHQKLNATYKLPLNKLPLLGFVKADVGYTADFDWRATSQDTTIIKRLGNVIQNANTKNANLDLNFATLYRDLKLEDLLFNKKKKATKGKDGGLPLPRVLRTPVAKTKDESVAKKVARGFYNLITSVKTGKFSYSENNGQFLQGYQEGFGFLGGAPTSFAFGSQVDIRNKALTQGWLVDPRNPASSEYYTKNYKRTHFNKFDYSFNVKPFKDLDITIIGNKIKTKDFTQPLDVLADGSENGFIDYAIGSFSTGNFSTSYAMISTIFTDGDQLFQQLKENRAIISGRLARETGQDVSGFGENSQQVLLPAFLSAFGGEDPNKVKTGLFRDIPIPNWTLRYNGLMKLDFFKNNFSNFVITHGYKSSYTISSFTNNLQYDAANPFTETNSSGNYNPELLIASATLVDEFSPLIKVDMKMKNSLSFRGEIKKDRTLTLNFNNNTLTDIQGLEYVIGFGYVLKDVKFNTRFTGKKQTLKGDINLRADISLRDNLTVVRAIDAENDQISGGQKLFSIKFTADYKLSSSLTASMYYNHQTTSYAISTTFPRQAINAGLNIIYNLGQ